MDAIAANDKYSGRLEVTLAPSRGMALICGMAGLATLAVIAAMPLPAAVALALSAYVACLAWAAIRVVLAPHRLAIELAVVVVDGAAGALRAGSFVAPWLAVLRWRPAGARVDRTLLISPDRLPAADFRHLRVILKNTPT
jgi:hypothetical protein